MASVEDQKGRATASLARSGEQGETVFAEADRPTFLVTIARGRAKAVKMISSGKRIVLERLAEA